MIDEQIDKKILIPTRYVKDTTPLIFLAGPVKNAPEWRNYAIDFIRRVDKNITIAVPAPTNDAIKYIREDLSKYIVDENESGRYTNYRNWKEKYEDIAANNGALMFWIPREEKEYLEYEEYGLATAYEIEYWADILRVDKNLNVSVGIEGTFKLWNAEDYDNLFRNTNIQVQKSLEHTLHDAINKCKYQI
jgi:hypothetical protein